MLAKGAKLDLHSENGQGPRPIHWASRNGHVAVVDILLSVRVVLCRKIQSNITKLNIKYIRLLFHIVILTCRYVSLNPCRHVFQSMQQIIKD